ncbi:MAG: hypothetical protein N3A58_00475 [Spirochaetes bacterium]|nr:hypothetical protein [Spirochaetota bacterium]
MEVLYNLSSLSNINEKFVLTIGNFDGIHKGHFYILKLLKEVSLKFNLKSVVFTFLAKPSLIKSSGIKIKNIFPFEDKIEILKSFGFDYIIIQEYDEKFFKIEKDEFLDIIFSNKNFCGFILGENFKFGRDRKGDIDFICKYFKDINKFNNKFCIIKKIENIYCSFNETIFDSVSIILPKKNYLFLLIVPLYFENSIYISSTYIREKIEEGDFTINNFLYVPFYIKGIVEEGKKVGRSIGFQTANIYIYDQISPKPGVYFTITELNKNSIKEFFYSMTYVGKDLKIETHIFNFNGIIYEEYIKVYFIERLRDNKKIESLEELKMLLQNDKKNIYENYPILNIKPEEYLNFKSYKKIENI